MSGCINASKISSSINNLISSSPVLEMLPTGLSASRWANSDSDEDVSKSSPEKPLNSPKKHRKRPSSPRRPAKLAFADEEPALGDLSTLSAGAQGFAARLGFSSNDTNSRSVPRSPTKTRPNAPSKPAPSKPAPSKPHIPSSSKNQTQSSSDRVKALEQQVSELRLKVEELEEENEHLKLENGKLKLEVTVKNESTLNWADDDE